MRKKIPRSRFIPAWLTVATRGSARKVAAETPTHCSRASASVFFPQKGRHRTSTSNSPPSNGRHDGGVVNVVSLNREQATREPKLASFQSGPLQLDKEWESEIALRERRGCIQTARAKATDTHYLVHAKLVWPLGDVARQVCYLTPRVFFFFFVQPTTPGL